jgi:hypothetical protein
VSVGSGTGSWSRCCANVVGHWPGGGGTEHLSDVNGTVAGLVGLRVMERPNTMPHTSTGAGSLQVPWRRAAIVGVKAVHSAIFLLNSAAILHVFVAGVWNRPSRWTSTALIVAFTEVAVFLANRGRCPLTDLVEHLGAERGRVSDIFLPQWFADRIPQLCGPTLLVGVLGLLWHRRHVAWPHTPGHGLPAERRMWAALRMASRRAETGAPG